MTLIEQKRDLYLPLRCKRKSSQRCAPRSRCKSDSTYHKYDRARS